MAKVSGIYFARTISTITPPTMKSRAITGTTFSVTAARRLIPPIKMIPQKITRQIPMTQEGMWKALAQVEPMEFD